MYQLRYYLSRVHRCLRPMTWSRILGSAFSAFLRICRSVAAHTPHMTRLNHSAYPLWFAVSDTGTVT